MMGSNSKFKSRSFAKSRSLLPVVNSEATGELPKAGAGIPEIRILVGFPALAVARACKRAAH
uniref:GRAS22 protein n=1 Tax=Rhizophora mucronata TaxID=61149 RepID=A0A2P2JMN0_RHIMU